LFFSNQNSNYSDEIFYTVITEHRCVCVLLEL
jgi:hypothetical protein